MLSVRVSCYVKLAPHVAVLRTPIFYAGLVGTADTAGISFLHMAGTYSVCDRAWRSRERGTQET